MEVRLTLTPGQPGTKRLVEKYGEQLVCVRYRYDRERGIRHKTVELIVDSVPWQPLDEIVQLQVARLERDVQRAIKRAGGRWNPQACVWELSYGDAKRLGLLARVVKEERVGYDETSSEPLSAVVGTAQSADRPDIHPHIDSPGQEAIHI